MAIEKVNLPELSWPPGTLARVSFCQPALSLSAQPPYIPVGPASTLALFEAVLAQDAALGQPEGGAPSIIIMPELALAPTDVLRVRELMATARANTLLVAGVGQMTQAQVDTIEPDHGTLFEASAQNLYSNCALIVCAGAARAYLQPKIVPSAGEHGHLWPGQVVRYFSGTHFAFVVSVCSDLLERAGERTTVRWLLGELDAENFKLSALFWLQHNRNPRSVHFQQSLEALAVEARPTVFVCGSRGKKTDRYENYSVSGAFFQRHAFPRKFRLLTQPFHYVEPVANPKQLSRVVLLRYDVDVNQVQTVLASALETKDTISRSQLFLSVRPFILTAAGVLEPNIENKHLEEIADRATTTAANVEVAHAARIQALSGNLVALGTQRFQEFLDRAIIPQPPEPTEAHAAGEMHPGSDRDCQCWQHRRCIDRLCDCDDAAEPLAQVLLAMARIEAGGFGIEPMANSGTPANVRLSDASGTMDLCVVYPFGLDAEHAERAIRGGRERPRLLDVGHVVLGTSGRSGRPRLSEVLQGRADKDGPVRQGDAEVPVFKAVYYEEFMAACDGNLREFLRERLA